MNDTKDPILQALIDHAQELAKESGHKIPVEVWAWVVLEPGKEPEVTCKACFGLTASEICSAYKPDLIDAKQELLKKWRDQGCPTKDSTEMKQLIALADKHGFELRLKPKTQVLTAGCATAKVEAKGME